MSSRDDQAGGAESPPPGRIFVPEGPMWDAWVAPGGGAVKLSAYAMKMEARWLRRARPRPFGFAPGGAHPGPARIGKAYGAGTLSSGVATMLGFRTAVRTMAILYGEAADPRAPAAEVTSDFHRDYRDRDLEEELLKAAGKWAAPTGAPDAVAGEGRADDIRPEVTSDTIDVVVSGRRRPVPMLRLGEFSAFGVREAGVLVTVVTRHLGPEIPGIVRLTDIEPMLSAWEHPDTEAIAAALAESRRRRIEQMRNQTRHSP